jgi:hypothetical protein
MTPDRRDDEPLLPSPAERHIARARIEQTPMGPLSSTALERPKTVEGYLRGAVMPRWMERARQIASETERHRADLREAYDLARELHAGDPDGFARAWRARVQTWPFAGLNELIEQHNEWYPIERDLPLNPRTGEYVLVGGRSYRRPELGPDWILEQFPAG